MQSCSVVAGSPRGRGAPRSRGRRAPRGSQSLVCTALALPKPESSGSRRRYWGGKRDHRTSYRRRCDQPCRSTLDTRRVRRLNCRLPTLVRPNPSVFDSKCIRVDDGCVSMSWQRCSRRACLPARVLRLGQSPSGLPAPKGTHGSGRVTQSKQSPEYPGRFSKVTFHGIPTQRPAPHGNRDLCRRRPQDAAADTGRGPSARQKLSRQLARPRTRRPVAGTPRRARA